MSNYFSDAGDRPTWFAICTNINSIPICDEVIAFLQARVDTDGFMRIGESLKPGDKVRVKSGPWKALVGVVEREHKSNERSMILLDSLKFQSRLTIERDWVEKIS